MVKYGYIFLFYLNEYFNLYAFINIKQKKVEKEEDKYYNV